MTTHHSQGQDQPSSESQSRSARPSKGTASASLFTLGGVSMTALGVGLAAVPGPLAVLASKLGKHGLESGNLVLSGIVVAGLGILARQWGKGRITQLSDSDTLGDIGVAVHGFRDHLDGVQNQLPPIHGEVQLLRSEVHQFAQQLDQKDQQSGIFHVAGSVDKLSAFLDTTLRAFGKQMDERMGALSAHLETSAVELRDRMIALTETQAAALEQNQDESDPATPILERLGLLEEQLTETHEQVERLLCRIEEQTLAMLAAQSAAAAAAAEVAAKPVHSAHAPLAIEVDFEVEVEPQTAEWVRATESTSDLEGRSCVRAEDVRLGLSGESPSQKGPMAPWLLHQTAPMVHEFLTEQAPLQFLAAEDAQTESEAPGLQAAGAEMQSTYQASAADDRHRFAHALDHLFKQEAVDEPNAALPSVAPASEPAFEPVVQASFQFESLPADEPPPALPTQATQESFPIPSFARVEPRSIPGAPASPYPIPVPLNTEQAKPAPETSHPTPYQAPKEAPFLRFRFPGLGGRD